MQVGGSNRRNGNKMPEMNSTSVPSLVDFDVTHLSEEEISTLREVLEREWVLQEENAQKKRYSRLHYVTHQSRLDP